MRRPRPTVDLGYPTPAHGRVPSFASVQEEAAFWDTHDFTDYLEETQAAAIETVGELAEKLTVRLDRADRDALVRQAKEKGLGPSTLARIWLKERLRQETDGTRSG